MTYHFIQDNEVRGPIDADALAQKLRAGALPADTLVCEVGATEWKSADAYAELRFSPEIQTPAPASAIPPTITPGGSPPTAGFDMSIGSDSAQAVEVLQTRQGAQSKAEVIAYSKLAGSNDVTVAKDIYAAYRAGMRLKQVRVHLNQGELVIEAGALHYMRGTFDIEAKSGGAGKWLKSKLSGESTVKPRYRGTGLIHLEPTFGHFIFLDLQNETWIVDQGMFYASEGSVNVDAVMQSNVSSALFGGEGLFQTQPMGQGWAILSSPVPPDEIVKIQLNNDRLQVDGNFALARRGNIQFSVEKSAKSLWSSFRGGEGLLQTFNGTGEVWLAPTESIYADLKASQGLGDLANTDGSSGSKSGASKVLGLLGD